MSPMFKILTVCLFIAGQSCSYDRALEDGGTKIKNSDDKSPIDLDQIYKFALNEVLSDHHELKSFFIHHSKKVLKKPPILNEDIHFVCGYFSDKGRNTRISDRFNFLTEIAESNPTKFRDIIEKLERAYWPKRKTVIYLRSVINACSANTDTDKKLASIQFWLTQSKEKLEEWGSALEEITGSN